MILPIFSHLSSLCSVADNFFYSNVWYPYMRPSFKCLSLYINISNIYVHVTYMCKRNIFFDPGCNNKKRLGVLDKIYPSFSCLFLSLSLYLYLSLSLTHTHIQPFHLPQKNQTLTSLVTSIFLNTLLLFRSITLQPNSAFLDDIGFVKLHSKKRCSSQKEKKQK